MAAKVEKIPKHLSRDLKVAAIELSKAKVPLKKIRDQLNISESSLRHILRRLSTLRMDDSDYLKALVESMPRRLAEVIKHEGATTMYQQCYTMGDKKSDIFFLKSRSE
jgi:hypothetical protein